MAETYLFTDTTTSLTYTGDGDIITDDGVDPSGGETVTREDHWVDFFDTDTFVAFDATLAQPIDQPYVHDGELKTFRKDEDELRKAQAQIDNMPWTMGHPPGKRVRHASQIRGVWTNPHWSDGQQASVHIPANDPEAVQFAIENDEVSIGFSGVLDWLNDADVDAIQRDIAYDHGASVENGRCPREKGCGLHTDSIDVATHGHIITDASVRSELTEEGGTESGVTGTSEFAEGDWVSFTMDGQRTHGKVRHTDSERTIVAIYDTDEGQLTEETRGIATSNLREWAGPQADSCGGSTCHCGLHTFADAPEGIHVEDGNWFGVAPSENPDDEPKYDLNNCNDVTDAFNLRNNGDYDISTDTLVARIKRAAEAHDCSDDTRPWTDSDDRAANGHHNDDHPSDDRSSSALLADAISQASNRSN